MDLVLYTLKGGSDICLVVQIGDGHAIVCQLQSLDFVGIAGIVGAAVSLAAQELVDSYCDARHAA